MRFRAFITLLLATTLFVISPQPQVTAADQAVAATGSTVDDDTTQPTINDFLPEDRNIGDCISALPKPGCGSEAHGGWRQRLVLFILLLGLASLAWMAVRGARRARPTVPRPVDDAPQAVRQTVDSLHETVRRLSRLLAAGCLLTAAASVAKPVALALFLIVLVGLGTPTLLLTELRARARRAAAWERATIDVSLRGPGWLPFVSATAGTIEDTDGHQQNIRLVDAYFRRARPVRGGVWFDRSEGLVVLDSGRFLRTFADKNVARPTAPHHAEDRNGVR